MCVPTGLVPSKHSLPDALLPCRLIPVLLQGALHATAQHAQQPSAEPSFESLFCQESQVTLTDTGTDDDVCSSQPQSSGLSREPTQHEIQYMDEVDFVDNLGSLLGPGDSWVVPECADFETLQPALAHDTGSAQQIPDPTQRLFTKPFQELFPLPS